MSPYALTNIIETISEVPEDWIYKYYYKKAFPNDPLKGIIHQSFDGRLIKVRSIFNNDSNPSLCFFYKNGHYYWKDFSSGMGGDSIEFVSYILNKSRNIAQENIMYSYEDFLSNGGTYRTIEYTNIEKVKFSAITKKFTNVALNDFGQYRISLSTLNKFNIKELYTYSVTRGKQEPIEHLGYNFGFYCHNGLYQIYSPGLEHRKYMLIDPTYLIGSEQLEFNSDTCIIISGLKDICAISELDLDAEYVAPPSETTLLSKSQIDFLKANYKNVLCILDNDKAGIESMKRYKKVYNIDYVHINYEKDLAENNKHYSDDFLRATYTILINKILNR